MTVVEILRELKPVKPISRPRLYHYFRKFGIKPISRGVTIRPQHYPADTPSRILVRLGLANINRQPVPKLTPSSRRLLRSIAPRS